MSINLENANQSNNSSYQIVKENEMRINPKDIKALQSLESKSLARKVAMKTTSAVCCPLSTACCLLCGFCQCLEKDSTAQFWCDRKDPNGKPYCHWTTCECCWNGALPPETNCDLCMRLFDPCVYFFCFANEDRNSYLIGPERQQMGELEEKIYGKKQTIDYRTAESVRIEYPQRTRRAYDPSDKFMWRGPH